MKRYLTESGKMAVAAACLIFVAIVIAVFS